MDNYSFDHVHHATEQVTFKARSAQRPGFPHSPAGPRGDHGGLAGAARSDAKAVTMSASAGRSGRPWRRARDACLAASTTCHICRHPGAGEADHHPLTRVQLIARGLNPDDPQYLRPAHGTSARCPVCGRACNQEKNRKQPPAPPQQINSRRW